MSIQSEITRLSGNVSNALDAIEAKGVTIPTGANSDDLANLIGQISGGGGGGGSITQDQDGYLVLSPDGGGGGGGGLEYEEGTWTPVTDIAKGTITFTNAHSDVPTYFALADMTGTAAPDGSSNVSFVFGNWYAAFGSPAYSANGTTQYAACRFSYGSTSTGSQTISALTGTAATSLPFWATAGAVYPYTNSDSRYWKAGRTYKWIAVWAPSA